MNLKTGIMMLLVGIALCTMVSASFSSWATAAISAMNFIDNAGFGSTVSIGLDDKNDGYHRMMKETKPYPNIEKEWGVYYGNHQYAGYSGYKLVLFGNVFTDDTELEMQCGKGMHAHAWIRPWSIGEHTNCV